MGSYDHHFYCLDALSGESIWSLSTASTDVPLLGGRSSPAVAGDYVFFGYSNYVYCLDAFTGNIVWNYALEGDTGLNSPAIANGTMYITTEDGYIYAFG